MKDAPYNIYERCNKECKSDHCDDYGADYCADWHSEEEHHHTDESKVIRFCAKMAFLAEGCNICQEYWAIHREIQDGEKHIRICHECQYQFEITAEDPYNEVLYDKNAGHVYFTCDGCAFLENDTNNDIDNWLDEPCDDMEDEIDRMAELMEMGRI